MKHFLQTLLLCLALALMGSGAAHATAVTQELVAQAWGSGGTVSGQATVTLTNSGTLLTTVVSNLVANGVNTGPKLYLLFSPVLDMRKFQTLQVQYKLSSNNSYITADGKDVTFTFCDSQFLSEEFGYTRQQNLNRHLTVSGSWQTLTLDLRPLTRAHANELDIWLDYLDYYSIYNYTLQIQSIKLVGATPSFDGAAISAATAPSNKTSAHVLTTSDWLGLKMTSAGAIVGLTKAPSATGTAVDWSNSAQAGGFLVRDTTTTSAPTQLTGTVSTITGGYSVAATSSALHLTSTCSYTTSGNMIHVSMSATNTASTSRFLTYYFALPVKWGSWTWQADLLHPVTAGAPSTVNAAGPFYEETTTQYPVAALNNATSNFGVALAVPLDQPRNYRIEYNEQTGVFYVAFDIALSNITASSGGSLNTATADVYLYAADPTWGLRSALQSFYASFPGWFTQHTTGGGWQTDTNTNYPGLRFDWGQTDNWQWTANTQGGILNFTYVEPDNVEFSMTDRDPSNAEGVTRVTNLAAASATEWTAIENLHYTQAYAADPYAVAYGLEAYEDMLAKAVTTSGVIRANGTDLLNFFYATWMAETGQATGLGMSDPCNLDPLIPNGRGTVAETLLQGDAAGSVATAGGANNGWALDEYICDDTYDYRSANFTYTSFPLSFERDVTTIAVPVRLTMAAWIKHLSQQSWSAGMLQFGNLQGNVTFSAPYMDVFGTEGSSVADPAYHRELANQRAVTYLPYVAQPDAATYYNLLYDIYPGQGLAAYQYSAIVPTLDTLFNAGWQPVTYATASVSTIRVERYGSGDPFFLVCYNTDTASHSFTLTPNTASLGVTPVQATELFGPSQGSVLTPTSGAYSLTLAAGAVAVLEMQVSPISTVVTFATPVTISADTDVLAPGTGQTVVAAYSFNGSGTATVNGVAFKGVSPGNTVYAGFTLASYGGWGSSTQGTGGPFGALSASYQTVLGATLWGASNSAPTVLTLTNLIVGKHYTVRFWEQYAQGGWGEHDTFSSGTGASSAGVYENETYYVAAAGDTTNMYNGVGQYVTATFTAGSSTQVFNITSLYGTGGASYGQLTALEVVQGP